MAKKRKGKNNKPVSKRGHIESSTIRYRLEQELVRVDRKGQRLGFSNPTHPSDRKKLLQAIQQGASLDPPSVHPKPAVPTNVSSFAEAQDKRKAKEESSVSTQLKADDPPVIDTTPVLNKPVLDKEVGAVSKPLDRKFWDPAVRKNPLAPSGVPISEFVTGKYKPEEKAVVYTNELPPTPTRDWRASPVNDNNYDNAATEWVYKTQALVQWFINHVEPQNWPTHIYKFAEWANGGWLPNTGAINKAVAAPETELVLVRSLYEGLEKDWRVLDGALSSYEEEIRRLRADLAAERTYVNALEYDLAHRTGDQESADAIRREMNIGNAKTPDNADELLLQYNMFKSEVRSDGLPQAFTRWVYNDPALGKTLQKHADMLCEQRQAESDGRNFIRFLHKFAGYWKKVHAVVYTKFWQDNLPAYDARLARRADSAVTNIAKEVGWYKERSSIYYSSLKAPAPSVPKSFFTNVKAGIIIEDVNPRSNFMSLKKMQQYVRWWENQLPHAELKYAVETQPVKAAIVRGYNSLIDTLNTEVNPMERKRKKDWIKNKQAEYDERREEQKERKAAAKERKKNMDAIRKAQRMI